MIVVYMELVKAGRRTLESIPEKYREEVAALLKEGAE